MSVIFNTICQFLSLALILLIVISENTIIINIKYNI